MSISGVFFTNKGRLLQAKAQTGSPLHFTRIALGDGELNGAAYQELNNLIHHKLDIDITKLTAGADGTAKVGGVFNNDTLENGFYYRELGLFAQDPDTNTEVLYCYGNAGVLAEYIPAHGSELIEKRIDIIAIIGNATNVSASINSSLVYLTQEDLDEHNKDPNSHLDIRELIKNIDVKTDVEEVVNRRVNNNTSKSLNVIIGELIDGAKSGILSAISTLTSHVTSKTTEIINHVTSKISSLPQKSVWTDARGAKLDNLNQSLSTTQTNINNNTNTARDNIKTHMTTEVNRVVSQSMQISDAGVSIVTIKKYETADIINLTNANGGEVRIKYLDGTFHISQRYNVWINGNLVVSDGPLNENGFDWTFQFKGSIRVQSVSNIYTAGPRILVTWVKY